MILKKKTISVLIDPKYEFCDIEALVFGKMTTVQPTKFNGKNNYLLTSHYFGDETLLIKTRIEDKLND